MDNWVGVIGSKSGVKCTHHKNAEWCFECEIGVTSWCSCKLSSFKFYLG